MAALSGLLGDRVGGEALVPAFTFVATAQAAIWSGLRPRLTDIDPDHWHMAPSRLERRMESPGHTRAVIAVSAFGTPPPPDDRLRWERACRDAGVPLIVDSAAGFGAVGEDGVPIGAQGDVEVVSFHATKPFAIGEGGAVFTRDRALHERIRREVNFGFQADRTTASGHGLNAKMSELHAATALAVLDDFDEVLKRRSQAATKLRERIGEGPSWQLGCDRSTWQFVPLAFENEEDRALVLGRCGTKVETRTYYQPIQQLIADHVLDATGGTPHTERLYRRILCLPMANDLADEEIAGIAVAVSGGSV